MVKEKIASKLPLAKYLVVVACAAGAVTASVTAVPTTLPEVISRLPIAFLLAGKVR
jgi:hypothetical protein